MNRLADLILSHKRLVIAFWAVVTVAAFAAVGPAGDSLSQQFNIPGREGYETNKDIAEIYGSGGDVAPLVPVVTLPKGTTVDSPGVTAELASALARVKQAMPDVRIASYASTHDRELRLGGRTHHVRTRLPPRRRRRRSWTGRGSEGAGRTRRRHRRRIARRGDRDERASCGAGRQRLGRHRNARRDTARRARRPARPHLRLPLVHGDRAAADGGRRHPDHVPAHLADRERHGRLRDRPVPRRADRARDRDRLRAPRRRPLARGTPRRRGRKRDRRPQCDEARRLRCRLQRHHRRDLAALAACSADARPPQHRDRRPADRARQRRRRQHPSPRRPRDRRAVARPAPLEPGPEREPRLVCLGADRRPTPLDRCERLDRRPRCARSRGLADPARRPAGRLARPEGPCPRRPRAAEGLPASAPGRCHRSKPSSDPATPKTSPPAIAKIDGIQTTVAPADWRRDGTAIVTIIPTAGRQLGGRP